MSRTRSSLFSALALVCGVFLGVALDRGGPFVSAQAAKPAKPEPLKPTSAGGLDAQTRSGVEDAPYQQLARQYEQFEHVNRTFELVAKVVSPSVVHIVAQKTGRSDESSRIRHYEETGSGVIVRGDQGRALYVLTNNHVVEGAAPAKVSVFLQDGRSLHPDRFWLDAKADIAVLNLGRDDLPAARLGNSDNAAVGSWVLALGSPFGLTHSVSQGIISARGRHMDELPDVENQDFLQTDAAINPGNSGGPLVNMKGEVIGINNSIASNGGGNEGVGFSIPINLARWIMSQLLAHGRVSRGALGVDLHPEFRPEDALALGLERPRGAWVDVVHQFSPAADGGLRADDVILQFKGVEVFDLNQLINLVSMAPIGQPAEVVIWRDRKKHNMHVTVGEKDRTLAQVLQPVAHTEGNSLVRRDDRLNPTPSAALGLELLTLDEASAQRLGLPRTLAGVAVTKVAPDSPLIAYLKPLDAINSINGRSVHTADEAARALVARSKPNPLVLVLDRLVKGTIERRTVRVP